MLARFCLFLYLTAAWVIFMSMSVLFVCLSVCLSTLHLLIFLRQHRLRWAYWLFWQPVNVLHHYDYIVSWFFNLILQSWLINWLDLRNEEENSCMPILHQQVKSDTDAFQSVLKQLHCRSFGVRSSTPRSHHTQPVNVHAQRPLSSLSGNMYTALLVHYNTGPRDLLIQSIGVARGCSGCTCTPRAVKKFFRTNLQ